LLRHFGQTGLMFLRCWFMVITVDHSWRQPSQIYSYVGMIQSPYVPAGQGRFDSRPRALRSRNEPAIRVIVDPSDP
jgi:hypothetical protein